MEGQEQEQDRGGIFSGSSLEAQALQQTVEALRAQLATQSNAIEQIIQAISPAIPSGIGTHQETKDNPQENLGNLQAQKKAILPRLQEFDGKRSEWAQWHQQAKMKLEIDSESIGDARHQFAYIFATLRGSAAQATLAYVKTAPEQDKTGVKLLEYMDNFYGDPVQQQRATISLTTMRQKEKESFSSFLPRFESTLANAGGMAWPDPVKIALLNKAITEELRLQRIGHFQSTSYKIFVSELLNTSMQIATEKILSSSNSNLQLRSKASPDAMDWKPTPRVNKLNITPDTYKYRRANNLCLRCGKAGHWMKNCTAKEARVSRVTSQKAAGKYHEKEEAEAEEEDYSEKE